MVDISVFSGNLGQPTFTGTRARQPRAADRGRLWPVSGPCRVSGFSGSLVLLSVDVSGL